ncbi:tripartite tricarboxylate transporter substrate binding protein [Ramlibacter sp. RBP-2]|uniref:Tripartite tricarboxylate transporter substrate binding protein n=1 Tax=Ramlibacter lithotrophicus TaxID=2606681 RepID=A0A7X6DKH6_9BURK|nr:tripartite tricarboxylate transporter substrate-binding protein [Ramlibacter lithotrophicus]NKE68849.1 tripartite tricarboxylate transporter substrate binding protein [Ramlibacter lithotrophicus]
MSRFFLALIGLFLVTASAAQVQFPTKPIRIISVGAGGTSDLWARVIGKKLSENLGQPVFVENRPGAGGGIAAQATAAAASDGYTIMLGSSGTHGINASLYKKLPYDPVKDFSPITFVGNLEYVLVATNTLPAKDLSELVALSKSKAGGLTLGYSHSTANLLSEMFKLAAGINVTSVGYKVGSTEFADLMTGRIDIMFSTMTSALPFVRDGRIKALAVPAAKRSSALPNVPTISESGYPGFAGGAWVGFFAPAGVSKEIVTKLNNEIVRALRSPDVQQTLRNSGLEVETSTPEEFGEIVKAEVKKWATLFRDAKLPTAD